MTWSHLIYWELIFYYWSSSLWRDISTRLLLVMSHRPRLLKGTVSRDILLQVFFENSLRYSIYNLQVSVRKGLIRRFFHVSLVTIGWSLLLKVSKCEIYDLLDFLDWWVSTFPTQVRQLSLYGGKFAAGVNDAADGGAWWTLNCKYPCECSKNVKW